VYGIAGIFATGSAGAGSFGLSVAMNNPTALAVDTAGNVYVADTGNHRVLFMPRTTGTYFGVSMVANWMYVIAGTGVSGNGASGSLATSCAFNSPTGICVDSAGNVFIADNGNSRILFIPKTAGTYFGSVNATTNFGNYIYTMPGYASLLNASRKITVDSSGNFTVASYGNRTIVFYPVANGTYFGTSMTANTGYRIVGTGSQGISPEGTAIASSLLNNPQSARVDSSGNLYIADFENHRIVFVPQTAGTYFGVSMTANSTYTIAGANTTATQGFAGDFGPYASSRLQSPTSVCLDVGGNVVIADTYNSRIRMVVRSTIGSSYVANNINLIFNGRNTGYFINGNDVVNYPNPVSLS
jgi:sugar lactone lactonase YvrE